MERYHPPVFEHARLLIEPVLAELGFSLAEEHYHQRNFGSAYAVYFHRGGELRLIWAGKEETLLAGHSNTSQKNFDWRSPSIRSSGEIPQLIEAIQNQFRAAVEQR
jgi:hypothetical protein